MEPPFLEKRKSDVANENKRTKKQKVSASSKATETLDVMKMEVKKIMQSLRNKLYKQRPAELTVFIRDKLEILEKDTKQMVGVFGKTGAGKSSLINAILDETDLLPSGGQGACTSAMIRVEANLTNDKYIAEIEFIPRQEWKEELLSIFIARSGEVGEDDDSNDDDEDEMISAFYGKEGNGKTIEELMDKKYFSTIPEFHKPCKKTIICDTAEELSEKICCFTRSDTQNDEFEIQYWPLVKCITLKVPNSKDLLEYVVLVDLPGNGDCNESRDKMWKKSVGNCSAVWIVSDIARATSEKECWEIFDSTIRLFGNGGECRSISFICTKTDIIDKNKKEDVPTSILNRNKTTKDKVRDKFEKHKEVKKHFSVVKDVLEVFTASSEEYKNEVHLGKEETEIPSLQGFLQNLNNHRTRTSDYIHRAYGILSLIKGAKNCNMTDINKELCHILEKRLKVKLKSIGESMEGSCEEFVRCLSQGVQQSEASCEKLLDTVISPKGKKGGGFHKVLKTLCKNEGVYKKRAKKNRGKEINLNESLASCMRKCIDEEFKNMFPNDKHGPIREQIEEFTLDATSLIKEHPSMELYLTFLMEEERDLKAELIDELREKKKKIYFTLTESILESMRSSYEKAFNHSGKDSLKRMKDELHQHVKNANIFQKAKNDMLERLTELKVDIVKKLESKLEKSIEIPLKTSISLVLPDVNEDYYKVKEFVQKLQLQSNDDENCQVDTSTASTKATASSSGNRMPSTNVEEPLSESTEDNDKIRKLMACSSTKPATTTSDPHTKNTRFQSETVMGQKNTQGSTSLTGQHIRKPTYRLKCPQAGVFQCGITGLVFEMADKGDVCFKMSEWDISLLNSMTPAGPLFSINGPGVIQLQLPHCMYDVEEEVMSVAHLTGGTMEIVKPLKTTASHVVVNIPNPTLVGLIRREPVLLPIQSQVLLFLCPQENTKQSGKLNVFLLPKNVPIFEVNNQQKGNTFIKTNSECTLSPGNKYGLLCELGDHDVHLKSVQFDGDYRSKFVPTFEVNLDCISDVKNMQLSLLERENYMLKVWECVVKTG